MEESSRVIVLSAHLDDAVLSVSHRLRPGAATVVTVFAGLPRPESDVSTWDAWTGADSSFGRMRQRHDEDDEAMRRLGGVHTVRLNHLEYQYRGTRKVDAEAIIPTIEKLIEELVDGQATELWAPAGIGGHPDHLATRATGLRAAERFGSLDVVLYADFPYVASFGWPDWAGVGASSPYLDGAAWLENEMTIRGLDRLPLRREVIHLDQAAALRRRYAAEAYQTQLPALGLRSRTLDTDPDLLRVEIIWHLSR